MIWARLIEEGLAVLRLDRMRALVDVYPGIDREDEMVAASGSSKTSLACGS
ncbi:hypothetical protein [uncultured Microbacterium sp.]|uniref:hypothetical protein n=1 Tax=uncultured Microbacterium sp. TaxID=191216 RepID=UPI0028D07647|nr:hypothetical protein [uncultured Microbacterium sp.]